MSPRTATADRVDRRRCSTSCARAIAHCSARPAAAMTRQGTSLLRTTIEQWGPVSTGGFPPGL